MVSKKVPVWLLSLLVAAAMMAFAATPAGARPAKTQSQTFTIHLDARAHAGEPWAFLKFFPNAIQVHGGDVIHAKWSGTDTPHTATLVNTDDPEGWRAQNQGPGGPYEVVVPDSQVGGDDDENVINPSVLFPSPPGCGDQITPCPFDGSSVVTSGVNFPNPGAQPSFAVQVTAPVGSYSLLGPASLSSESRRRRSGGLAGPASDGNRAQRALPLDHQRGRFLRQCDGERVRELGPHCSRRRPGKGPRELRNPYGNVPSHRS